MSPHVLDQFLTELQDRQRRCKAATGLGWQNFWAYAEEQTGISRKSWRMLQYPEQWYRPTKAGRWNPSIHHLKELEAGLDQMEGAQAPVIVDALTSHRRDETPEEIIP